MCENVQNECQISMLIYNYGDLSIVCVYTYLILIFTNLPACICVHEQSYYTVHYTRRKEEGKEGRKKRTNTNNLQQRQRLRKLQQLKKIMYKFDDGWYTAKLSWLL